MIEGFKKKYKDYEVSIGCVDEPMWKILVSFTKSKLIWDCFLKELRPVEEALELRTRFQSNTENVLELCDKIMSQIDDGKLAKYGDFSALCLRQIGSYGYNKVLTIERPNNIISKKL